MQILAPLFPDNRFLKQTLTIGIMVILSGLVFICAKLRKREISIFPKRFSKAYIILTAVVSALYISAPENYITGLNALLHIYGRIVTPVYEEILFRGRFRNRCVQSGFSEWAVLYGV